MGGTQLQLGHICTQGKLLSEVGSVPAVLDHSLKVVGLPQSPASPRMAGEGKWTGYHKENKKSQNHGFLF